jgi:dTDP-4-amino-4,6-dideoxygalactose transaminase
MSAPPVRTIPFARPCLGDEERQAVAEVLGGSILTHGPQGQAFEAAFAAMLGAEAHAVVLSSCMAALHLACLALGLGPGDEVIVPAQTHVATVHAVEWVGARPVFVDCDAATGNVTPAAVADAVTPRTRAIAVVHFVGIPCDMAGIMAVAGRHDLRVIEDCALALGARIDGRHVGLFGDAGCFSFYPTKHITTGEGGMLVSRRADVAAAATRLRGFGVDRSHTERTRPGIYDVPQLGLNYRMSEMQAALGRVQLGRLAGYLDRRRAHFTALRQALGAVPGAHVLDSTTPTAVSSHYCLGLVLDDRYDRDAVVGALRDAGIGTSVYYPHPIPRLRYYRERYGYEAGRFPHAATISDRSIALPVGPHLAEDDVLYTAARLRRLGELT